LTPDLAPAANDLPREVGRYAGDRARLLVICIGGMHGNEPAGVFATQRVRRALKSTSPPFRGTLVALAGNRAALARGCRFVAEDLNRIWLPEHLAALSAEAAQAALNVEERECRELLTAIAAALARATESGHARKPNRLGLPAGRKA
jgi:succinylglutamate desuccinylase